ncbi:phospho-sugar mutase, partial [Schumannella luteola]
LGWRAARRVAERNIDHGTLACSLVSSPALGVVARKEGLDFAETLTGFKWISRVGDLLYGYEEALGYLV